MHPGLQKQALGASDWAFGLLVRLKSAAFARIEDQTGNVRPRDGTYRMGVEINMGLVDAAAPAIGVAPAATLFYVGFWRRLAAYALDFAIFIPTDC